MTINIQPDFSLKPFNTFGFDQQAEFFCTVNNDSELEAAVRHGQKQKLAITVLGGGSNVVLANDIKGLVIHPGYTHIRYLHTDTCDASLVVAGAGIVWDELVAMTLDKGLRGLENLTLIPGTVGAAPVQNIGAYGVEADQRIVSVRALHLPTLQWHKFSAAQCQFSYRNSYFKQHPNQYVISEVHFKLGDCHALNYQYDSLQKHLQRHGMVEPDARQISQAVASIRSSRLPDPAIMGNAGSFFHNPVIDNNKAQALQLRFPDVPVYPNSTSHSKLSAAWLIDKAGCKGMQVGNVGVYDKQALVLVNHGNGTAEQLLALARQIQDEIKRRYDIDLQIEPTVI